MPLNYTRHILSILFIFFYTYSVSAHSNKFRCMWRDDPATTMVIGWHQASGHSPSLYYDLVDCGKNIDDYSFQQKTDRVIESKGMLNHFVRLRGLQANTVYYFVIADNEGVSRRLSFKTAPDNPYERISIIAGGDSRNYRSARQKANQMVSKLKPHCVMFGGDMTGGDSAKEWKDWLDDWQQTIDSNGRMTPIIPTRGNHEFSNKTIINIFDVISPDVYYGLSFGGNLMRIYTLNSLIAVGGNQRNWLENDLLEHQDVIWKFAQYHYSTRPHTRNKSERNSQMIHWASLFYRYQVNVVVESDAHMVKTTWPIRPSKERGSEAGFIRDDNRGTVYVGEGCWGAPLRRNNDDKNWTRASGSFNQFKWIFVDADKIEIRTVKTDNVDEVEELSPLNVFQKPKGIDIWQPSNGSVITILRDKNIPTKYAHSTLVSNEAAFEMTDFTANINNKDITVNWITQKERSSSVVFELQRTLNGQNFETIAKINGAGPNTDKNKYQIIDKNFGENLCSDLSYRIKYSDSFGCSMTYDVKDIGADTNKWLKYNKLEPDQSGMLRVKYHLEEQDNVSIWMLNRNSKEVNRSDYKNQRIGNYLKAINMQKMPKGQYLLIIKAGQKILHRYQVHKEIES